MASADIFLVSSNVHFMDDSRVGLESQQSSSEVEPSDDVFYLSRLNDPTTYFFQWICKRYRLTVKREALSCPICLETSQNNIQLSCGHTFCRQCLKAAAEQKMASCALCRKSHTLDPDVLRAQFNQHRFANLSWRLGKTRATRAFSKPSWEAVSDSPPHRGGGGGGCKACGEGGTYVVPEEQEEDLKKGTVADMSEGDKHDAPDIGALPRSLLMLRAAGSKKGAFLNQDCGASSAEDLRQRWHALFRISVIAPDAGAQPIEELSTARWQRYPSSKNVGGEASASLRSRWTRVASMSLEPDSGAMEQEELKQRWKSLASHFSSRKNVGAHDNKALQASWANLMESRIGSDVGGQEAKSLASSSSASLRPQHMNMIDDIGGLSEEELKVLATARMPAQSTSLAVDCGASSVKDLRSRWATAFSSLHQQPTTIITTTVADVGGMESIHKLASSSMLVTSVAVPMSPDCGEATQVELKDGWRKLLPYMNDSQDCGEASQEELSDRARKLLPYMGDSQQEDVGALSPGALAQRWKELQPYMGQGGGEKEDIGGATCGALAHRWKQLQPYMGQGGGEKEDIGDKSMEVLAGRWGAALGGSGGGYIGDDVGGLDAEDLRQRWKATGIACFS